MTIGQVTITGKAALAPMAGVADRAFRRICRDYGAAFTVGEMVSSKGLCYNDQKSHELLITDPEEKPAAVQLFGDDPDTMAKAAQIAVRYQPDWIDINFGCPAPKIVGNHYGSALMREPDRCQKIVEAVAAAVDLPVTVKIRKGYSKEQANAVEVALACEAGGAAAITVHGRTRDQMYAPPVDWDVIAAVKQAVNIPVIGNGDVTSAQQAARLYEHTGCDLVMVGRGALGAPWIFSQIEAYLSHGKILPDPPISTRMAVLYRQTALAVQLKGERVAMREARKHATWYMKGWRGAAALRGLAVKLNTLEDLAQLCQQAIQSVESATERDSQHHDDT